MNAEAIISQLNIELPPPPTPAGVYKPLLIVDNLAYLSGHGPVCSDGSMLQGRVGSEVDLDGGYRAARQTGLALLSTLRHGLGSLDRVVRVVKVLGLVNSTPDFHRHPAVINGCSELFAQVFGQDAGVGTRSALGVAALPGNISVEIEAIFEIS